MSLRARSIADFAATVRGRRQDLNMSQAELAERTGISRKWISEFERRKARAELLHVLRVLEALDVEIDLSTPPDRYERDTGE